MASPEQAKAFRRRIGFDPEDITNMPQDEVDEMFDQAASENPSSPSQPISAVIIYLEGLFVDAAKLATFKKNNTTKNVSDIFNHIKDLISYYNGILTAMQQAADAEAGNVRSGKTIHRQRAYTYPSLLYPAGFWDDL